MRQNPLLLVVWATTPSTALRRRSPSRRARQPRSAPPRPPERHATPWRLLLRPPASLAPLKVATWNLEWLNRANGTGMVKRTDADYDRLRKYADLLNADVIAVQEVDGEDALRRVFDDATYDYHVASQSGIQLTGFAYRSTLSVTKNADYAALDVGGVRTGTDLTVTVNGQPIRLLSVHLKSGCFDQPLNTSSTACTKLNTQLPLLEAWIDARATGAEAFLVLGDFNRRMKTGEAFYTEIDDGQPANADLTLATDGRTSTCWDVTPRVAPVPGEAGFPPNGGI